MAGEKKLWKLRRSGIHGSGMFAADDIPKGARIIEYVGVKVDKDESLNRCLKQEAKGRKTGGAMVFVFDLNDKYDLDGNIPNNPAKYINHSCDENCEAVNEDDQIFIYSKKKIPKGAELTFDYGYDIEFYEEHPCRCGSPKCVGYIVTKEQRKKLRKLIDKQKVPDSILPGKSKKTASKGRKKKKSAKSP